ncbi:MAG: membrane protein insertion efficiency factor YidD [Desulfovibrionaceae bacterium]|nr:membrane protein insertion efficiency factor YidD [Desulfovibrionaceae bacterium]
MNVFFWRRFMILPIRVYQLTFSAVFPPCCRFTPSCSAYAIEAIMTHGVAMGLYYAVRRILRCNPWFPGGYDPVPPPKHENFQDTDHGR